MPNIIKKIMIYAIGIVVILAAATFIFMRQPKFGKAPTGAHLEEISKSPNFKDGVFQNLSFTPDITEGYSYWSIIKDQFFSSNPRTSPTDPIPTTKTDLHNLDDNENVLVWFGHSSYFMQLDGVKILVDPVFSGRASPVPGTVKAFPGTDRYSVEDIPEIDYLLITHDHYDHIDYKTIVALEGKVKQVVCGLGVGSHFEFWGYSTSKIHENDWFQEFEINSNFKIHILPARHFSGRGFKAKNTLWVSYLLETKDRKIYVGGDSGYDTFFKDIGNQFGPIDLVILDNGQYNDAWREIHFHPEEVVQVANDLQAKHLFPVHSSKFVLAMHPWDEPLMEVDRINNESDHPIPLFTPIIGEKNSLDSIKVDYDKWWESIE